MSESPIRRDFDDLIDAKELARRLSFKRGTVFNWISDGTIPKEFLVRFGPPGARVRIWAHRVPEIIALLQNRKPNKHDSNKRNMKGD